MATLRPIFLLILLLSLSISVFAENTTYAKYEKYLEKGKFLSCWKATLKSGQTDDVTLLYQAVSLAYCPKEKKVLKAKINVPESCLKALQAVNVENLPEDLPMLSLHFEQLMAVLYMDLSKSLKRGESDKSKQIIKALVNKTYNPKKPTYNRGRANPAKIFVKRLKKTEDLELISRYKEHLKLYISSMMQKAVFTFEGDKANWYVQSQGSLFLAFKEALDNKKNNLEKLYANLLVDEFNSSSEVRMNFHVVEIYQKFKPVQTKMQKNPTFLGTTVNLNQYVKKYQLEQWDEQQLKWSNNGSDKSYHSEFDKEIIFLTNLVRVNPKQFLKDILLPYYIENDIKINSYSGSLKIDLGKAESVLPLFTSKALSGCAMYMAEAMGKGGATGHVTPSGESLSDRAKKYKLPTYLGENCSYAKETPLGVLMQLLIDDGVSSLGHRLNILRKGYANIGVATADHTTYGTNTVMDFTD
ncbi:MAG: hypothetical protein ACI9J3_001730 [Parvicellaceae bacterium]|jgi:hypothetical protein